MTEMLPVDPVTFGIGHLPADRRADLLGRLHERGIDCVVEGTGLVVGAADEEASLDLLAEASVTDEVVAPGGVDPALGPTPSSPFATRSRRFVGLLLDGLLAVPVSIALALLTGGLVVSRGHPPHHPLERMVVMSMLGGCYFVGLVATRGRTLGMRAASTRVVSARTGEVPTLATAAARWAVVALPGDALLLGFHLARVGTVLSQLANLAVYVPMFVRRDQRGLHDLAAGTVVVRNDFQGVPPPVR